MVNDYWSWINKHKKKEADSSTSQAVGILAESSAPKKSNLKFVESTIVSNVDGSTEKKPKFKVILIKEGLGNLNDLFFYTKEALHNSYPLFEGKKLFLDHPDRLEEKTRPERSVRDVFGHFENVRIEESQGRSIMVGDLVLVNGKDFELAKDLMHHAVEYSQKYLDKDFIGLSINAAGDADDIKIDKLIESYNPSKDILEKLNEAAKLGATHVRAVRKLDSATSCDLVTEAGAGGRVISNLIERNKIMDEKKHENEVDKKEAHADAEQDKALIADMLKKHLGDEEHDEKDMEACHEAFEFFHKDKKMDKEEAAKHAVESMRCAKHMQKKHEAKKHEGEEPALLQDKKEAKHHEDEAEAKKESEEKKEELHKKESEIAKLTGRVAFLEAQINAVKVKEAIEKKLQESKLPMKATKIFKESLTSVKTVEEFDKLFTAFKKGFDASGEASFGILDLSIEKTNKLAESENRGGKADGALNFSDCLKY